jgi:phosphoserine phosphatase RsbU/P
VVLLGGILFLLGGSGGALSFVRFLSALAGAYLLFRVIGWWRARLLWSLRNRLIVAYLFIALVPVLLLGTLALFAGMILYTQLGGYLLYIDLQHRVEMASDGAEQIAAALGSVSSGVSPDVAERIVAAQEHAVYDHTLPGLIIEFADDPRLLKKIAAPGVRQYGGLIQQGDKLTLIGLRAVQTPRGLRAVELRVPITPEFLATLAPDLGAVRLEVLDIAQSSGFTSVVYPLGDIKYQAIRRIPARNRALQAPARWFDPIINGVTKFEAVNVKEDGSVHRAWPVVASFNARPSHLNARLFASLGELGVIYLLPFVLAVVLLLAIEVAALITGIVLTRRITYAVADLYNATQFVKAGDFSHRVKVESRDQLAELGESFNQMTASIADLLEEQQQRLRLQNELSIAREVQNQLFPKALPSVPGVEIEAICKAARSVSGDYYDFIQLSPTHIAIAIADISGKGISAALLMASLQAALRSLALAEGSECLPTEELVSRLNRHLVRNTADDRFATFFIAVYDSATRTLRYTNAGHLPAFLIGNGSAVHLDKGGMVLGVFEEVVYEGGTISVPPDALLVGYSDGLIEPENAYGEEFGIRRLRDTAVRYQGSSPRAVAESLMTAAEEWAGTPEQADDMTVIVARLR